MSDIIEFTPADPEAPKLKAITGREKQHVKGYCNHGAQLLIDTDTQLVECSACHMVMSAYSALILITNEWRRMHYDTTEYRKMRAEQEKASKEFKVRHFIRQLQWIELPEEDQPEARRYWQQITEACGKEPYAMFRRGNCRRGQQYCVLDGHGGWADADFVINGAKRRLAAVPKEAAAL
jgi:galactokinase